MNYVFTFWRVLLVCVKKRNFTITNAETCFKHVQWRHGFIWFARTITVICLFLHNFFQRFVDGMRHVDKNNYVRHHIFICFSASKNDCFYVIIIFVRGCAFPYTTEKCIPKAFLFVRAKIRNVKNDSLEYSDSLRASYLF